MRASQWYISTNPLKIKDADQEVKIFMLRNRSVSDTIYLQFGGASNNADAWPILAGDVFALDPAAPKESIYVWGSVAGVSNTILIG